jgi:hypothetical protein
MPRENESFQILEKINDNSYKVDLPSEYGVSVISMFFISLCLMYVMIRELILLRRGDDTIETILKDPLQVPIGPITRSREKKLTDAFNRLIHNI